MRGSTRRGGIGALRKLLELGELQHLAITPDGPRGPRPEAGPGPDLSGLETPDAAGPVGFRVSTGRGAFAVGIGLPSHVWEAGRALWSARKSSCQRIWDRDGMEHFRVRIETLLDRITGEAEAWAESGHRKVRQYPLIPGPVQPWQMRHFQPAVINSESRTDDECAFRGRRRVTSVGVQASACAFRLKSVLQPIGSHEVS